MSDPHRHPEMKQSQRIVKNVLASGTSTVLGSLILLAALVVVGRSVSVAEFGIYSFIFAFATFISVLADGGLSNILVRELATQPEKMAKILGAALTLIWVLSIAGELLIVAVIPFFNFTFPEKVMMAVMGLATMTQFHCMGYGAALRSREDNHIQALGYLLHKIVFFLIVVIGLKAGLGLMGLVGAHLSANLLLWGYYRQIVVRRYGRPHMEWDVAQWKYLFKHSLPLGGATTVRLAGEQADFMIIKFLSDMHTVGLFSGPYRIFTSLRLIPQTMTVPLYPMYARFAQEEGPRLAFLEAYRRSVKFFLLLVLPIATIFFIFAGTILTLLLKADYAAAAPAMQVLAVGFIPLFLSNTFPLLLTALHEQRYLLKTAILSFGLRVTLNFLLVPVCGFVGPCIALLTGESIAVTLWILKLRSLGFPLGLWSMAWRLVLSAGCMAAMLAPFQGHSLLAIVPMTLLASAVYLVITWRLGTFTAADLAGITEGLGFLKRFARKRPAPPVAP